LASPRHDLCPAIARKHGRGKYRCMAKDVIENSARWPHGYGGGYSGGGGGGPSGGGGSFDAGQNQILIAGVRSGNGEVVITYIFAGTPGAANCLGQSNSALAGENGGLGNAAAAPGYDSEESLQNAISAYCADVRPVP